MKKRSVVLLGILYSTLCAATPNVGDTVEYAGTLGGAPYALAVSLTDFNKATDVYTIHIIETKNGLVTKSDVTGEMKYIEREEENIRLIVRHCKEFKGNPETLQTPAGTFQTCKINHDRTGFRWVASVPFFDVKVDYETEDHLRMQYELVKVTSR